MRRRIGPLIVYQRRAGVPRDEGLQRRRERFTGTGTFAVGRTDRIATTASTSTPTIGSTVIMGAT
jgi:hypothetical protein